MNTQGSVSPLFSRCLLGLILSKYGSRADLIAQSLGVFFFFYSFQRRSTLDKKRENIFHRTEAGRDIRDQNSKVTLSSGDSELCLSLPAEENSFVCFWCPLPPRALSGIVSSLIRICNVFCSKERQDVIRGCWGRPSSAWWHDRCNEWLNVYQSAHHCVCLSQSWRNTC